MSVRKGLLERLENGEGVIVGEGYLMELEARGYLQAGGFVPEVVLEHPNLVRDLHREFVHAGSDVVVALTYYGHREKLRLVGREDDLEKLNRKALRIAREVADETGTLMAGNLSKTTLVKPGDKEVENAIYKMFEEQIRWAVEESCDFVVAETFSTFNEALLALRAIKEFGNGVPAVVTVSVPGTQDGLLLDRIPPAEACLRLEEAGAAVVGLNCSRGPATMLPILRDIRRVCKVPLAGLPAVFRTDDEHPVYQGLPDIEEARELFSKGEPAFPSNLTSWACNQNQIARFSREAWDLGVRYLGLCCGNRAHFLRTMAETVGRQPPASRYSPDMSKHYSRLNDDRHDYDGGSFPSMDKVN